MVDAKSLCHLTILLLSLCFMAVKCSLEPTDQFIDNPTDTKQADALTLHKRPSFFVGSRYGRSGSSSSSGSSLFATSKTRRLNVVPRNDRFFLSSRYGKRAGMDFLQNTNINNNKKNINDNSILVPLLSTPYEQALISEISTGTQLSNKPIPEQQQQQQHQQQQFDDVLQQQSSSLPPYAYMSCIYTGLQNYYRCNSIDSTMFYFKNAAINDDENENEVPSTGATGAGLLNDDNDDDNILNDNDVDDDDKK
ncbi:RYamide neuropeptide [Lucilia cuprina]|nr:RYamide neuropeptide [Lucilia cuprina]